MENKGYDVYKAHTNTFDRHLDDWSQVMELIKRKADKLNFGSFRRWEDEKGTYFDVGPTVYLVKNLGGNK